MAVSGAPQAKPTGVRSMRIFTTIVFIVLAAALSSCDRRQTGPDVDPVLGRDCFERHRGSLPPGTQYEGIDGVAGNRLTIRIMNGADVTTVDCGLNPDGALEGNNR
jgi:hypothetical protein